MATIPFRSRELHRTRRIVATQASSQQARKARSRVFAERERVREGGRRLAWLYCRANMAVGGGAAQSGSTDGEAERHLLEGELHEVECTLLGEMQQIERLAQENNEKVCATLLACYRLSVR